jgi:hypothetical protein
LCCPLIAPSNKIHSREALVGRDVYGKQACRTIYTAHGQVCIAFVCFFDVSNGTGDVAHYGLIRRTGQDAECMADTDIRLVGLGLGQV